MVWTDRGSADGSGYGVFGQRYDADGLQVGEAFLVRKGNPKNLHSYEDVVKNPDAKLGVVVTASIGYTLFPSDDADADTLLRHADQAMYAAKQAGRNRFHQFDAAQERALQLQREQGRHLREALAAAQFTLYLQPKVDMRSGAVVGAEALARWQHPERGLVPPGEFLPLLEGTELEIDFGEWVVEAALTVLAQLQAHGLHLPLSINIAAQHLQQPGQTVIPAFGAFVGLGAGFMVALISSSRGSR